MKKITLFIMEVGVMFLVRNGSAQGWGGERKKGKGKGGGKKEEGGKRKKNQ